MSSSSSRNPFNFPDVPSRAEPFLAPFPGGAVAMGATALPGALASARGVQGGASAPPPPLFTRDFKHVPQSAYQCANIKFAPTAPLSKQGWFCHLKDRYDLLKSNLKKGVAKSWQLCHDKQKCLTPVTLQLHMQQSDAWSDDPQVPLDKRLMRWLYLALPWRGWMVDAPECIWQTLELMTRSRLLHEEGKTMTQSLTEMCPSLRQHMDTALAVDPLGTPPRQGLPYSEADDNECLHRMAYYCERIWNIFLANKAKLDKGDVLEEKKGSTFQWKSKPRPRELKFPFNNYATLRGPIPEDFLPDDVTQTRQQQQTNNLRQAFQEREREREKTSSSPSPRSQVPDDFEMNRIDAMDRLRAAFPLGEQCLAIAEGQFDFSCMFNWMPASDCDAVFPFDLHFIIGQDSFRTFEVKYRSDILGNKDQWYLKEKPRIVTHPLHHFQKTLLIIDDADMSRLPPNHHIILGTLAAQLNVEHMIPTVFASSFLRAVLHIYELMYAMTHKMPFFQHCVANDLPMNTAPQLKANFLGLRGRPSDNRATPVYHMGMWLRSMYPSISEAVITFLYARCRTPHHMQALIQKITPAQRKKFFLCVPGLGEVGAEQLSEQICPSATTLFESQQDREGRQALLRQMPTNKKQYSDGNFFPLGHDDGEDADLICPPEDAVPLPRKKKKAADAPPPRKRTKKVDEDIIPPRHERIAASPVFWDDEDDFVA